MKLIDIYIAEKLHLNKGNKGLVTTDDPIVFIESFDTIELQAKITSLISMAIHYIEQAARRGHKNRICYIVKEFSGTHPTDFEYKWSMNIRDEALAVGDTDTAGNEILYVVTKDTVIPKKYEKFAEKYD